MLPAWLLSSSSPTDIDDLELCSLYELSWKSNRDLSTNKSSKEGDNSASEVANEVFASMSGD